MERTVRLQVPVEPEELKALKLYSAERGVSMAELIRLAIEVEYGDDLRDIEKRFAPSVSARVSKRPQ
jgi:hypothetical protein